MAKKKNMNELALLKANVEMLDKTLSEAKLRKNTESIELIKNARKETLEQIRVIDPKLADELSNNSNDDTISRILDNNKNIINQFDNNEIESIEKKIDSLPITNTYSIDNISSIIDSNVQYDVITLPSNGQCYRDKKNRIPVSYLTAYDENLITSPNLYKDGLIIDFLLKHKVLDKEVDIDSLCSGDVDAITLFLRATSYGPEFPIIVRDPETREQIETVVDLSQLKVKEFKLIGDSDGYFDFTLPVSKDLIKFKFLTRKDEKILKKLSQIEDNGVKAMSIKYDINTISDYIKEDDVLNGSEKQEILNSLSKIENWVKQLETVSSNPFSKTITNRLELSIMAVNGNYDREYISKYVNNMGAKDSLMLRRYMIENEPGINFEIDVKRPESLGGGSFKTFLEWDDSIFLNIA